jgi:hypothetical protein
MLRSFGWAVGYTSASAGELLNEPSGVVPLASPVNVGAVPVHGLTGHVTLIAYVPLSSLGVAAVHDMVNDVMVPPVATVQTFACIAACALTGSARGTASANAANLVRFFIGPPSEPRAPVERACTYFTWGRVVPYEKTDGVAARRYRRALDARRRPRAARVGTFVILWGIRRYVQQLAILLARCPAQGHEAPHRLMRRRTTFMLFCVPLFPISTSYQLLCTACGNVAKIDKARVDEVTPRPRASRSSSARPRARSSSRRAPRAARARHLGRLGTAPAESHGSRGSTRRVMRTL